MSPATKDFYKVLGVSEKATPEEIKKAYRGLAKRYHPDANPGNASASDRFKEVGEAYSVLSDSTKRKQYDQMRRLGAFGLGGGRRGPSRPGGGPSGERGISIEDLGGLSDILGSFFDRGGRKTTQEARGPQKGNDVEYVVDIAFEVAVTGGRISITVPMTEECATCGGDGAQPGTARTRCKECNGAGTVSFGQGGFAVKRPCPACLGRGRIPTNPCEACAGTGSVRQNRKIEVTVPQGVDSGSKVRLTGQGERGMKGGARGDLLITFKVKPHRFFKREGRDIHVSVPINIAQATMGTRMSVKTIHGKKVVLKIPAGTQPGTRFRVRGHGIRKGPRVGDQIVEVRVEVPGALSEKAQEAIRQFAEVAELNY